jgi:hypothetical protein
MICDDVTDLCCPDFDPETGEQLNMVCVCGAKLPLDSAYSICKWCLRDGELYEYDDQRRPLAVELEPHCDTCGSRGKVESLVNGDPAVRQEIPCPHCCGQRFSSAR